MFFKYSIYKQKRNYLRSEKNCKSECSGFDKYTNTLSTNKEMFCSHPFMSIPFNILSKPLDKGSIKESTN